MEPSADTTDQDTGSADHVARPVEAFDPAAARPAAPSPEAQAISDIIAEVRTLLDRLVER